MKWLNLLNNFFWLREILKEPPKKKIEKLPFVNEKLSFTPMLVCLLQINIGIITVWFFSIKQKHLFSDKFKLFLLCNYHTKMINFHRKTPFFTYLSKVHRYYWHVQFYQMLSFSKTCDFTTNNQHFQMKPQNQMERYYRSLI